MNEIQQLASELKQFAVAREWRRFHTPKNLAMALAGEVGELLSELQWLTPEESQRKDMKPEKIKSVELEIADATIYLILLADALEIDLLEAVREKIKINENRF